MAVVNRQALRANHAMQASLDYLAPKVVIFPTPGDVGVAPNKLPMLPSDQGHGINLIAMEKGLALPGDAGEKGLLRLPGQTAFASQLHQGMHHSGRGW